MTVYGLVIISDLGDSRHSQTEFIEGIYSTREKAEEAGKKYDALNNSWFYEGYDIVEFKVDDFKEF